MNVCLKARVEVASRQIEIHGRGNELHKEGNIVHFQRLQWQ
jgi:hypothetical protein